MRGLSMDYIPLEIDALSNYMSHGLITQPVGLLIRNRQTYVSVITYSQRTYVLKKGSRNAALFYLYNLKLYCIFIQVIFQRDHGSASQQPICVHSDC